MAFERTLAATKIINLANKGYRYNGVPGGTSAAKTYSIIPVLITYATLTPNLETSIVSESFPHLRRGAIKEFKKIMKDTGRWSENSWSEGPKTYTFPNKSYIEFFSVNDEGKVHGPRRDILFVNECQRIKWDTFHALATRTNICIWVDFNPTHTFWYHTEIVGSNNWGEVKLTHLDNHMTSAGIKYEMAEAKKKHDQGISFWVNWYRVYGLGLTGTLSGLIYPDWKRTHTMPPGANKVYGIDLGYGTSPTVMVELMEYQGNLYRRQIYFAIKSVDTVDAITLNIEEFIEMMYAEGIDDNMPILSDHDELFIKAISEAGFNILKAKKSPGSVLSGILALQQRTVYTTYDSLDIIKEEEMYRWSVKHGVTLPIPVKAFDHGMDATRYAHHYILDPLDEWYLRQSTGSYDAQVWVG